MYADSKLPLTKPLGAGVGDGVGTGVAVGVGVGVAVGVGEAPELTAMRTLSNTRSVLVVFDEMSVNIRVAALPVATNV